MRRVLGIETSCDETAAAVVASDKSILANIVHSQLTDHSPYGGVVPEIAARAHLQQIAAVVEAALAQSGVGWAGIDAVAATTGPGLIGGVIVGAAVAKALAFVQGKPFIGVNHLEGHALTCRLSDEVAFPYLLLLVSGGHSQVLIVRGVGHYERLGGTIDDAVGEAFDKTAKMLGLGFPGGPAVEAAALAGDPHRFALPRPMLGRPGVEFSFSGLKTAVRQCVERLPDPITAQDLADVAAGFQQAVADVVADRIGHALTLFKQRHPEGDTLVLAGGVAANRLLRSRLAEVTGAAGVRTVAPPLVLCTDNGAMIAWAGVERLALGRTDPLSLACRPRWPLESLSG